jgi:hypothetical protein
MSRIISSIFFTIGSWILMQELSLLSYFAILFIMVSIGIALDKELREIKKMKIEIISNSSNVMHDGKMRTVPRANYKVEE